MFLLTAHRHYGARNIGDLDFLSSGHTTTTTRDIISQSNNRLIDLLHLGALVAGLVIVLDGEAELDHAVDAAREGGRLVEREARCEERRLKEQVDRVLDRLVALVGRSLRLELLHDRVL